MILTRLQGFLACITYYRLHEEALSDDICIDLCSIYIKQSPLARI